MQPVSHLGTRGVTSLLDLRGCPWQGATPTPGSPLLVALGEGLHSASPNGLCGLPSGSFAGADVWSLLFESGPAGEGCFSPRPRLSRRPSPCGYLLSLCWALASQLVWVTSPFFTLLRPLLWQKGWPDQGHFLPPFWQKERPLSLLVAQVTTPSVAPSKSATWIYYRASLAGDCGQIDF